MEAVAEFDFHGRADDELSFQKGSTLLITDAGQDENWYKALQHGLEGYIPKNYVNFSLPCWFYTHVGRSEAEKLLTTKSSPIGSFCIRKSESISGAYSLSVRSNRNTVQHYKILPDKEGLYYIWLKKFNSLDLLVDYYKRNSVMTNSTLFLKDPPHKTKKCKALFDFKPLESGEMALKKGQIIQVIDNKDPNWWKGCGHGKHGLFPANYVTLLD